jgi:hypothetical protein
MKVAYNYSQFIFIGNIIVQWGKNLCNKWLLGKLNIPTSHHIQRLTQIGPKWENICFLLLSGISQWFLRYDTKNISNISKNR